MTESVRQWSDRIILWGFHLLFFLVPLILTPWNYELFEYNKMMITYALTVIIVGAWVIKYCVSVGSKQSQPKADRPLDEAVSSTQQERKTTYRRLSTAYSFIRTPFDIPIVLFVIGQIFSTFFSIDRHVSLWGYYSRFNGGLVSTFSYVLLYSTFVNTITRDRIKPLLTTILTSATLVSLYGIAEHFGIDKHLWVQDVQNRVFSTLGQPNWLAAYLTVLIPVSIGLSLNSSSRSPDTSGHQMKNENIKTKKDNEKLKIVWPFFLLTILLYVTLIFTKSRSGLLGVWFALAVLGIILFIHYKNRIIKPLSILLFSFLFFHFIYGTPFGFLNRFTLPEIIAMKQSSNETIGQSNSQRTTNNEQLLEVGITESADIRKIVWKGSMDIIHRYPLFGSGVETFAFSYYQYRPAEHNMTSEWDFLYNKAHNEYLNYAATTGLFGLGTYLLFIGSVIRYSMLYLVSGIKHSAHATSDRSIRSDTKYQILNTKYLTIGLFTGWLSILVTNFFGFSVVIVQLFFFLIPAFLFTLSRAQSYDIGGDKPTTLSWRQTFLITVIGLVTFSLLWKLGRTWYADTVFSQGYYASRSGEYAQAYKSLSDAIRINQREPFYFDELAIAASQLALAIDGQTEATLAADMQEQAVTASDVAIGISPNNVNYWKTRTRVLYTLSQLDELYLPGTLTAIEKAKTLSPTDPKIRYNLALVYNTLEKHEQAYRELEEAVRLKPNYKEPVFALALFYERDKQPQKAKEQLNYILTRIDPNDEEAKKMLEELN